MIQWIFNNKEWLFSGAGVTVILLVGGLLFRRLRRRKDGPKVAPVQLSVVIQAPPPFAPPSYTRHASVSPREIMDSIQAAPLLLQPDMIKQYVGIHVGWEGYLHAAQKTHDGTVRLHIGPSPEKMVPAVVFEVAPEKYPGLGLLKSGARVRVKGIIANVESLFIELTDASIDYEVK